jgi:hypothetical protein
LKPIIETIDRHGLLHQPLAKHKPAAREFLDWIATWVVSSEVAGGYQGGFQQYGDRLFNLLGLRWGPLEYTLRGSE